MLSQSHKVKIEGAVRAGGSFFWGAQMVADVGRVDVLCVGRQIIDVGARFRAMRL